MDLQTILGRIELNFFNRIDKNAYLSKEEVKKEFNSAIEDVLITTFSRVMKDAKEIIPPHGGIVGGGIPG